MIRIRNIKKKKLGMKHRFKPVYVYDDMFNLISVYESFNKCVQQEQASKSTIQNALKKGILFRGYILSYNFPYLIDKKI